MTVHRFMGISSLAFGEIAEMRIECFFIEDIDAHEGPIPVGAMWYVDFYLEAPKRLYPDGETHLWVHAGPDGHVLCVKTPGGHWIVDSRCSNCGSPHDDEHACWVRHGEVPKITVDKQGLSCSAGGGSIQCGDFHGFLREGFLTD